MGNNRHEIIFWMQKERFIIMNGQRLLILIRDVNEVIGNLEKCTKILQDAEENESTVFIEFGLKKIFADFFIIVENFTSMVLKELKKYKIGIDMKKSLQILKENNIIDEKIFEFLNEGRMFRNRISHRYKEPSREELMIFINENTMNLHNTLKIMKSMIDK